MCIQAAVLRLKGSRPSNTCIHYLCGYIVTVFLSEGPRREPCIWLPVWPACGLHAGEVPLLRRSPSMEGMGMCALTSSEGHPPWKVWARVHLLVAKVTLHGRYGHVCTYQ